MAIARGRLPPRPTALENEKERLWSICQACWKPNPSQRPSVKWIYDALHPTEAAQTVRNRVAASSMPPHPYSAGYPLSDYNTLHPSIPSNPWLVGTQDFRRSNHTSEIGTGGWDFRPPAEGIYGNLDAFFPMHVLDAPVIGQSMSEGNSSSLAKPTEKPKEITIRVLVAERKKVAEERRTTLSSLTRNGSVRPLGSIIENLKKSTMSPKLTTFLPVSVPRPVMAPRKSTRSENPGRKLSTIKCVRNNSTFT